MPKTYRQLYDRNYDFEHLVEAYRRARRGKRRRLDVAAFEFRCEDQLLQLAEELCDGSYMPGRYRRFAVTENGKRRVISAAPFRDRVMTKWRRYGPTHHGADWRVFCGCRRARRRRG